jgi:3',5'-cyclic AMP phosphodiesterase CpdA
MARAFLARLGPPDRVTAIPGNHDAYVRGAEARYLAAWKDYLSGDVTEATPFPFVRRRGPVAIVALSTAVATLPFFATGRLRGQQLARFESLLATLRRENCFRVVLIHHPPAGERSWLRRFEDAEAFRGVVARHGADLVLTGHDHIAARHEIPGPDGAVPVVQVPAATARFGDKHGSAAYNLYRIGGGPGAWACEVEVREIRADGRIGMTAHLPLLGAPLTSPRVEATR